MNVLVPLNNMEHLKDYIESGATEFYMGFYDEEWTKAFGDYADINRLTGFREKANPNTFQDVLRIVQEYKNIGITIYITFNASLYSEEQLVWIENYMVQLKSVGVDGVIVSCMELVLMARKLHIFCVISTIAGVYNEDLAQFYTGLGADRIILPRDLSVQEIEDIVLKVPDVEYEVFMMRNGCAFSDSHCLGMHRLEKRSICATLTAAESQIVQNKNDFKTMHDSELNHYLYCEAFHNYACGLCALYHFVKLGINAGKIVGRSDQWNNICDDIRAMKENIEIAGKCNSQEEYLEKMVYPVSRRSSCKLGFSCYYPEMRFI